jgi:hypothetical protein
MKLELKHLTPYLPYAIRVDYGYARWYSLTKNTFKLSLLNLSKVINFNQEWKPILRPLSDITKEIKIKDKKFVPCEEEIICHLEMRFNKTFDFFDGNGSNENIDALPRFAFQKLLEWHFDVFGLIESGLAVDINNL